MHLFQRHPAAGCRPATTCADLRVANAANSLTAPRRGHGHAYAGAGRARICTDMHVCQPLMTPKTIRTVQASARSNWGGPRGDAHPASAIELESMEAASCSTDACGRMHACA